MTIQNAPTRAVLSLAALAIVFTAGILAAGPLNPPAGPVASTYKTLTEVEPRIAVNATNTPGDANSLFKITAPGSYYLTANVNGVSGKHGIEIAASGVTIDLRGFSVIGTRDSLSGVTLTVTGTATNVRTTGGVVRNWDGDGIDLSNAGAASACVVTNVQASSNAAAGIRVGNDSIVEACTARANGTGMQTGNGCVLTGCVAATNTAAGILAGSDGVINRCVASQNSALGFVTDRSCSFTACTAAQNGTIGYSATEYCVLQDCTARLNGTDGFHLTGHANITACVATRNGGDGIYASSSSQVRFNVSNDNDRNGIRVGTACLIAGNKSGGNGYGLSDGANIAVDSDNRIEDNICTNADRGLDASGTGNFIARNTCSGNGINWDIANANVCLILVATTTTAIAGNSGGTSPGSTNPNANYTY